MSWITSAKERGVSMAPQALSECEKELQRAQREVEAAEKARQKKEQLIATFYPTVQSLLAEMQQNGYQVIEYTREFGQDQRWTIDDMSGESENIFDVVLGQYLFDDGKACVQIQLSHRRTILGEITVRYAFELHGKLKKLLAQQIAEIEKNKKVRRARS